MSDQPRAPAGTYVHSFQHLDSLRYRGTRLIQLGTMLLHDQANREVWANAMADELSAIADLRGRLYCGLKEERHT